LRFFAAVMSVFKLKTLMYWCYGIVAMLIFSANFVGVAAYQYDVDSTAVQHIGLYRELATLASGLLLAAIIPAIGLHRLLPVSFLFTAIISLVIFIQPSAIAFHILYISLGFIFGALQIGFFNELASINKQETGLLSDVCHLEAVYVSGILITIVISGIVMKFQQFELHYLYLATAIICTAIGLLSIFKKQYFFFDDSPATARELGRLWLRTLPEIFNALSSTLVILAMFCLGLTITVTTFVLYWVNFFNTTTLQLSDNLVWQFSIVLILSTISGRLVIAALAHYLPLLTLLLVIISVSILCIMAFAIGLYQYQINSIPDTMAELPPPMMLIILLSFTNGGIVPLLIGTVTYHTPADKRGIMLGIVTFVMSGATLLSGLFFQWASKLFTPGMLLALMAIPLAFVMILSTLFINDLRKSTSTAS
jgi:hypothetical protein